MIENKLHIQLNNKNNTFNDIIIIITMQIKNRRFFKYSELVILLKQYRIEAELYCFSEALEDELFFHCLYSLNAHVNCLSIYKNQSLRFHPNIEHPHSQANIQNKVSHHADY